MSRSAGVTISAIISIVCSVITLLFGALMLLGSAFLSKTSTPSNLPVNIGIIVGMEALIFFGFGAWGLASGIGLIYLKQWARISVLVFAGILAAIFVPGALITGFMPFPNTDDPNLPSNFMLILRVGMVLFDAAFAALAIFWLYFFNKASVKIQFQPGQRVTHAVTPPLPQMLPVHMAGPMRAARPLSLTVIGWFLLIGSACAPLGLLFNSVLFPDMRLPLFFMGFFLFGRTATLILVLWMIVQAVAAVGLLKLKKAGLLATVALQCFGLLNTALLAGISSNRQKFQQIMEAMTSSMTAHMPAPIPVVFPMWAGFAFSIPFFLVILYFLLANRRAFDQCQVHQ